MRTVAECEALLKIMGVGWREDLEGAARAYGYPAYYVTLVSGYQPNRPYFAHTPRPDMQAALNGVVDYYTRTKP